MKFKEIPNEYYVSIFDKLTRFEPANMRYKKVFDDIINKFLLSDKLKNLTIDEEIEIAQKIINSESKQTQNDIKINEKIKELEEKYFIENKLSDKYLNVQINFSELLKKIEHQDNLAQNIHWLLQLSKNNDTNLKKLREEKKLLYPIEKILLCEGQTEHTLLEPILKNIGFDIYKKGVLIIPSGGKNQVAKNFYKMIEYTKLPFLILLDKDAEQTKELILPKLRKKDCIYLLNSGEFEDILPKKLITEVINNNHPNEHNCNLNDFSNEIPMAKNINLIYKKYGFGDFKKAEFSKQIKEYIIQNTSKTDFSNSEIINIFNCLQQDLN